MKYRQTDSKKSFNKTLSIVFGGVPALFWSFFALLGLLLLLLSFLENFFLNNLNIVDSRFIYIFVFLTSVLLGTIGLWEAILYDSQIDSISKRIFITIFIIAGIYSASLVPLNDYKTLLHTEDFVLYLIAISMIGPIIIAIIQILKLWLPSNINSKK